MNYELYTTNSSYSFDLPLIDPNTAIEVDSNNNPLVFSGNIKNNCIIKNLTAFIPGLPGLRSKRLHPFLFYTFLLQVPVAPFTYADTGITFDLSTPTKYANIIRFNIASCDTPTIINNVFENSFVDSTGKKFYATAVNLQIGNFNTTNLTWNPIKLYIDFINLNSNVLNLSYKLFFKMELSYV